MIIDLYDEFFVGIKLRRLPLSRAKRIQVQGHIVWYFFFSVEFHFGIFYPAKEKESDDKQLKVTQCLYGMCHHFGISAINIVPSSYFTVFESESRNETIRENSQKEQLQNGAAHNSR